MWNAINILYHWCRSVENKRWQHAWHITVQTSDSKQNEVECSEVEQNEVECSEVEQNEVECSEAEQNEVECSEAEQNEVECSDSKQIEVEHTVLLCSVIHITKPE